MKLARPAKCFSTLGFRHNKWTACPAFRQEQPQAGCARNLIAGERQGHQCLAVGVLAKLGGILRGGANLMRTLLGQARVIDDQKGIAAADEPMRVRD